MTKSATTLEELNEKLNKTLKQANDTIKELGGDAKIALTEDYTVLKDAIGTTKTAQKFIELKDTGIQKAKDVGTQVDDNVKEKPYHYIGGAAVIGLLVGILIGRK